MTGIRLGLWAIARKCGAAKCQSLGNSRPLPVWDVVLHLIFALPVQPRIGANSISDQVQCPSGQIASHKVMTSTNDRSTAKPYIY
jgi:hypothetical protein